MELCSHNFDELEKSLKSKATRKANKSGHHLWGRDQRGEAMDSIEFFLLGVLAGLILPLIIVVVLVRRT